MGSDWRESKLTDTADDILLATRLLLPRREVGVLSRK
jgi:hypothetical protein